GRAASPSGRASATAGSCHGTSRGASLRIDRARLAASYRISHVVYSDLIRERFRHPRYQGSLEGPDAAFEAVNPLCGDRIRIECRIADGRLADARHRGDSCAICVASADVLLERAIGEPLDLASRLPTADLRERLGAGVGGRRDTWRAL